MTTRRGRPPHPDVFTPAEWRVLEHLRLGRTNAEIAVRMGISVNTVRFHVSNMLRKVGVPDREALAAWQGRPRRTPLRGLLAWGLPASVAARGAAVFTGAVLLAGGAWLFGGGSPSRDDVVAPEQRAEAAGTPSATATASVVSPLEDDADFREYTADELEAAGMVDLGPVFTITRHPYPAAVMSARADLAAVRLAGDAVGNLGDRLRSGPASLGVESANEGVLRLGVMLDGRRYTLRLAQGDARTRFLTPGQDVFTVYSRAAVPAGSDEEEHRPTFSMYARDQDGGRYATAVDARGHLFLSTAPLSADLIIDYTTGSALERGSAMRFGTLEHTPTGVFCERRAAVSACSLSHHFTEGFERPVAGTLVCNSAQAMSFHAEEFSIDLRGPMGGGGLHEVCIGGSQSLDLAAGDRLALLGWWNFSATTAEGEPLSFGVDRYGNIYLGVEPPSIGCPCRTGN